MKGGNRVKEEWTGELIGKMHNKDITLDDLAEEIGVGKSYVSMILNGKRNPSGARERLYSAFEKITERKEKI